MTVTATEARLPEPLEAVRSRFSTAAPSETPEAVKEFLDALGAGNFESLERVFASDLWLRALTPGGTAQARTRDEAIATFTSWFGGAGPVRLVEASTGRLGTRDLIRYRLVLRPSFDPRHWYTVEQTGTCRVKRGAIRRLDLVCTGMFRSNDHGVPL